MSKSSTPSKTGYGQPPVEKRFKKGKSGNPKGRPKKSRNIATEISTELDTRITVREGGRDRRMSKGVVLAKSIVARALKGDMRAIGLLLTVVPDRFQQVHTGTAEPLVDDADAAILEDYFARRFGRSAAGAASQAEPSNVDPGEEISNG